MTDQNSNPKFKVGDFIRVRSIPNATKIKVYGFGDDGWPIVANINSRTFTSISPSECYVVPPDPVSLGWINVYQDGSRVHCSSYIYKTLGQAQANRNEDWNLLQTIEIFCTSP